MYCTRICGWNAQTFHCRTGRRKGPPVESESGSRSKSRSTHGRISILFQPASRSRQPYRLRFRDRFRSPRRILPLPCMAAGLGSGQVLGITRSRARGNPTVQSRDCQGVAVLEYQRNTRLLTRAALIAVPTPRTEILCSRASIASCILWHSFSHVVTFKIWVLRKEIHLRCPQRS